MKLMVKNDELDNVLERLSDNEIDLQKQLEELQKQIERLKEIWQGEDANALYNKAESYLEFLDFLPVVYNTLSSLMNAANNKYRVIDSDYANMLKKAVVKHE